MSCVRPYLYISKKNSVYPVRWYGRNVLQTVPPQPGGTLDRRYPLYYYRTANRFKFGQTLGPRFAAMRADCSAPPPRPLMRRMLTVFLQMGFMRVHARILVSQRMHVVTLL
jgi:hypothetical protein